MASSGELKGVGVGSFPARGRVFRPQSRAVVSSASMLPTLREAIAMAASDARNRADQLEGEAADILRALSLMLEDPELESEAALLVSKGERPAQALRGAVDNWKLRFTGDPELESRLADLAELAKRAAGYLAGSVFVSSDIPEGSILVLEALTALAAAQLPESVAGVVVATGSAASHAAIILRSRGIPAIFGCQEAFALEAGAQLLLDPVGNRVVIGGELANATEAIRIISRVEPLGLPVLANVASEGEARAAALQGAQGVGLFRTELRYLDRRVAPSEAEQISDYQKVFEASPEGRIYARTFDSSPDKPVGFLSVKDEPGYQVFRSFPEVVAEQLRALEGATEITGREVSVMAPLLEDAAEAKEFLEFARANCKLPLGVMVESPALAAQLQELEGLIDFVSVGTNDLSHRLAGLRRDGDLVADHFDPNLVAILHEIAQKAVSMGILSSVCGESAADPIFALVLAGLGYSALSVAPPAVHQISEMVGSVGKEVSVELAHLALAANSAAESREIMLEKLSKLGN